jgi:RNA polymerase sigma-70 factor (ECF subfamily)
LTDERLDDQRAVVLLRAGDEEAFEALVARHNGTMMAVARTYVKSRAVAEDVVQEAWLGVLQGLDRFEGRSSLKTWIIAIVVNKAKTRAQREGRSVPFTTLEGDEPAVEPGRFRGRGDTYPGHWRSSPANWSGAPDVISQDRETLRVAMRAISELPPAQQTVIGMRDIQGSSAEDVCSTLEISPGNQRVLLHRARSHVRTALEDHLNA